MIKVVSITHNWLIHEWVEHGDSVLIINRYRKLDAGERIAFYRMENGNWQFIGNYR